MADGEQFVMIIGAHMMRELYADSWDSQHLVHTVLLKIRSF